MRCRDFLCNLFFPPRCASCDAILPYQETEALCSLCRTRYEREKGFHCPECQKIHAECTCTPKTLEKNVKMALHVVEYTKEDSVSRDMILLAKDVRYGYLYRFMAKELAATLDKSVNNPAECLFTFVPRSAGKVAQFGVDQAKEVAKRLSARLGGDFVSLFYHKSAGEQKHLNRQERIANTKASYFLKEKTRDLIAGRRVILYDDVITTGATLHACITLLKKEGAKEIVVATFGKTYLAEPKL